MTSPELKGLPISSKEPIPSRLKTLGAAFFELTLCIPTLLFETWRTALVHPEINPLKLTNHPDLQSTSPTAFDFFQHLGDFYDGTRLALISNAVLSLAAPKLSERIRLGTSLAFANSIVIGVETGILHQQQPDFLDIPAGVAGTLYYLAVHQIVKSFSTVTQTSEQLAPENLKTTKLNQQGIVEHNRKKRSKGKH